MSTCLRFRTRAPFHALVVSLLLAGSSTCLAETSWQNGTVTVCAEDAGWPPFSTPGETTPDSGEPSLTGYNADLLARIFGAQGIPYRVVIRPWKRCLQDGIHGDVTLVLDAASNPERERDYLLTEPIYSLTPGVFFPAGRSEQYPPPLTSAHLAQQQICGQKGYIYDNFGVRNEWVDMVSEDLDKILDLVALERCDFGLARLEILRTELQTYPFPERIAWQPLSGQPREPFYWLLNRHTPGVTQLKAVIDTEMAILRTSGDADQLLERYLDAPTPASAASTP